MQIHLLPSTTNKPAEYSLDFQNQDLIELSIPTWLKRIRYEKLWFCHPLGPKPQFPIIKATKTASKAKSPNQGVVYQVKKWKQLKPRLSARTRQGPGFCQRKTLRKPPVTPDERGPHDFWWIKGVTNRLINGFNVH